MPASPHYERFTLIEDDVAIEVVALAHQELDGRECVLVVPASAFDDPDPDMDAWIRTVVVDDRGARRLEDVPDDLVDRAWDTMEDVLTLTFSGQEPA